MPDYIYDPLAQTLQRYIVRRRMATIRYEVRVEGFEEGAFDDRDAAEEFFNGIDDGCRAIELVKITETVLRSRHCK